MSGSTPASSTCFNCGAALTGPFCANCGQKALPLHPRIADFLHELVHETLHVDGKIFSSFSTLLRSPGFLTREYFEGRRARWVSPIRLYLIFSVLYVAIATLSPPSGMRVTVTGDSPQEEAAALQTIGFTTEAELREAVNHTYAKWAPRALFVLVPWFAWLVGATLKSAGRTYLEHLFFALHVHAAWFAIGALGLAIAAFLPETVGKVISIAMTIYASVYFLFALSRAYDRPMRKALSRVAIVLPIYGATILLAISGLVVMLLFGRGWTP
jgi:hypothetical protein